ncbi:MAG TPA: sugar phosphate nucleotidyltransferase [Tepidisphaeraceae bacterium]|nr:sugar phosphate nucleotidyltransferase [Tepidisphaeraceae bacterium]
MRKQDNSSTLDDRQSKVADSGVKALIPIKRPFLDYILSVLAEAGFKRICLVIGPEHDDLRRYYGQELKTDRLSIDFAVQEQPLGTANAVAAVEAWSGGEPFVMLNSDNYYPLIALAALRQSPAPAVALFERTAMLKGSNIPPERIQSFAVGQHQSGRLLRIVEKPSDAVLRAFGADVYLSMNLWLFDACIFDACRAIPKSTRGEYEITDAVQWCIDHDAEFTACLVNAPVLDLSSRADIGPVTDRLEGVEVCL